MVDLIDEDGNQTPLDDIAPILDLDLARQEAEALAARANMTAIVRMLHDRSSQLMDMLIYALSQGKLCVIDISQMRGGQSLVLSGLILRRIFDRNQQEFTAAEPQTIPTIAVVEEAQSVLNESNNATEPYVAWVKEGRKYDLGAVLVTQQPGSIPMEILSQGDNWFIFHLLSAADLTNVRRANAHFSEDLLSALLNEPIPGQGVFWSSVGGKPYPVSIRALSFERMFSALDPDYSRPAAATFASILRNQFQNVLASAVRSTQLGRGYDSAPERAVEPILDGSEALNNEEPEPTDILAIYEERAIQTLRENRELMGKLQGEGVAWGALKAFFLQTLPETFDDREQFAYLLVRKALDKILGPQKEAWYTFRNQERRGVLYIKAGRERTA